MPLGSSLSFLLLSGSRCMYRRQFKVGTVTHLDSDKCNPLLHAIWDGCDLPLLPFWVTEHADSPPVSLYWQQCHSPPHSMMRVHWSSLASRRTTHYTHVPPRRNPRRGRGGRSPLSSWCRGPIPSHLRWEDPSSGTFLSSARMTPNLAVWLPSGKVEF